jgi:hypothetical protein
MGVIRDPARNEPYIVVGRERQRLQPFHIAGERDDRADDPRFAALAR